VDVKEHGLLIQTNAVTATQSNMFASGTRKRGMNGHEASGKHVPKLAVIVSHPIQYYAPLYRSLARRDDLATKVFFTWHAGETAPEDRGFKVPVAWDIPVAQGYDFEMVPNVSFDRGTHRFWGLNNPSLVERVMAWRPDAVHITGWAWYSHLLAMRIFRKQGTPVLFRGDSHLIGQSRAGPRWWLKRAALRRIFSWPAAFLVVGKANRAYYEAFGVEPKRLHACPHSIDVGRFAEPADRLEQEAARWRAELGISPDRCVLLFAGKFEPGKRPLELMRTVQALDRRYLLVMVGSGQLERDVQAIARADPDRFRPLSFQNQSRMPVVYRLADLFVLPSAGETWGLAVNEALACSRPVLVSDAVGCAADVVDDAVGAVFSWRDPSSLPKALIDITGDERKLLAMRRAAAVRAWSFDVAQTEASLVAVLKAVSAKTPA
jgi:glycosyltransferase involved in cell wall biosynthesis